MTDSGVEELDGSVLEGGGQFLRMACSLSILTQKSISVSEIRGGRSSPGLKSQHKSGLEIARDICNGKLWGAKMGSKVVTFHPGKLTGGSYTADTRTAGSVSLLIQVALPCALFCPTPVELTLRGGTNASMAPQIDYTINVFKRLVEKFGASFNCNIKRRGYYPRGGGEVYVRIQPVDSLKAVQMEDPGEVVRVWGRAHVAGAVPLKVAEDIADAASKRLRTELPGVLIDVKGYKERPENAVGNGLCLNLFAETSTGCVFGGSGLGERGFKNPEIVATEAVNELLVPINTKVCVDLPGQDQIIILMALAEGRSSIKCGFVTLHTHTAIHVAHRLTTASFDIKDLGDGTNIISCEGIGYQRNNSCPTE